MKTTITNLKIAKKNIIKIIKLGQGAPRIIFISGVHGNEKTGIIILKKLAKQLKDEKLNGTVTIIPIANPFACLKNTRIHPEDKKDLNRCFIGNKGFSISNKIATSICNIIRYDDLIIDFHVFPQQISPIIGVYLPEGKKSIQKQSRKLLMNMDPDVIWKLDVNKTEANKGGSICSFALSKNIPAFGLELPPNELINKMQVDKILKGCKRVLGSLKIINHRDNGKIDKKNIAYERNVYKNEEAGFFTPQKAILTSVRQGEIIGTLCDGKILKNVYSKLTGTLLTISKARYITEGEKLFVVGIKHRF